MAKRILFLSLFTFLLSFLIKESVSAENYLINSLSLGQATYQQEVTVALNTFFNPDTTSFQITFYEVGGSSVGSFAASPVSPAPLPGVTPISDKVKFTVPNLNSKQYEIQLSSPQIGGSDKKIFTILSAVTGISPNTGNHQTLITINGSGFDTTAPTPNNQVYFVSGGALAITETLSNKLTVGIPLLTPVGSYAIKVFSGGSETNYASNVNRSFVLRPHITILYQTSGEPDSDFQISGLYFSSADISAIKIVFYKDGTAQPELEPVAVEFNGTLLKAKVPNFSAGNYTIKVSVNRVVSDNSKNFTITAASELPPEIVPGPEEPLIIFNLQPSGTVQSPVTLSFSTNKEAVCKYDTDKTAVYENMEGKVLTSLNNNYVKNLDYLAIGFYNYYVGCQEEGGEPVYNQTSFTVSLQPSTPEQPVQPVQSGQPGQTPSGSSGGGITIGNPLGAKTFEDLVNSLIKFAFYIALGVVPLMIIIAGFYYITAAGDPGRLKIAQEIILYTSIGLAVILLARGLIAIIKAVLGG